MREKCEECGTEFAADVKACPNCSAPVSNPVNEQPLVWRDADGIPVETTTGLPPTPEEQHGAIQDATGEVGERVADAAREGQAIERQKAHKDAESEQSTAQTGIEPSHSDAGSEPPSKTDSRKK